MVTRIQYYELTKEWELTMVGAGIRASLDDWGSSTCELDQSSWSAFSCAVSVAMVASEHRVSGSRTAAEHLPSSSIACFVGVGFDSRKSDVVSWRCKHGPGVAECEC